MGVAGLRRRPASRAMMDSERRTIVRPRTTREATEQRFRTDDAF